jgi:hypothetical protein
MKFGKEIVIFKGTSMQQCLIPELQSFCCFVSSGFGFLMSHDNHGKQVVFYKLV